MAPRPLAPSGYLARRSRTLVTDLLAGSTTAVGRQLFPGSAAWHRAEANERFLAFARDAGADRPQPVREAIEPLARLTAARARPGTRTNLRLRTGARPWSSVPGFTARALSTASALGQAGATDLADELIAQVPAEPVTPAKADAPTGGIAHGAFYASGRGNFGDLALPSAVREAFTTATGETSWLGIHVHQLFDDEGLELVNAQRAMILGGGGLFLPDTAPNGHSGWQWNVPQAQHERITVPLATFAVGYNLFVGQDFVGDRFRNGLLAMAEKPVFLGLRNHGSIEQVSRILPAHLHDRLRFVPCPTTILEHTHPGLPPAQEGTGTVLLNIAYDRKARRFGRGYPAFLAQIEKYVAAVEAGGSEVRCVAHAPNDPQIVKDLRSEYGRELPVDDLSRPRPEEGYALFRRADLVVGMRGHATMIPFGLGTPVLSIVSHPKTRYFLEDIDRPEWGFDVGDPNLADRLLEHTTDVLQHNAERRQDIREIQARLAKPILQAARDLVGA